ncbi:hypothetical protein LHYA1_G004541 [Lachnellula hyalina]|uniref:Uncharacterized protein n=1 Tax=Lachnellula hyalina TaxID=1316788 RepID=A0A8H8R143_9HELO|nr:uncharacterized protein LHYA1_G004541 [Lachnellula hyalina]TVY26597.1 hypothetical protein LHYA1_G004541 [Lachnellula hyalina]
MDQWGQHQLGPTLGNATKAVDDFGKDKLRLALSEVCKNLDGFGKTKLGPVLVGTGAALEGFGKNKLGPALSEVAKAADHFGHHHLGPAVGGLDPALGETAAALDDFVATCFRPSSKDSRSFRPAPTWTSTDKLSGESGKWIKEHPGRTALLATSVATIAAPSIVSGPLLWAFGCRRTSTLGGSAAAVVQSTVGNLAARGATGMALQDSATFPEHQFKTHILRIQVLSVSIGA